ncbi:SMI1/KNR4 family protein [Actinoplanes couchii]|uniref:HEAT repeat domain-containing protein n=1 Tax=Actinoplanes couchii TaxID=403638 RepID=A0ABQ3XMU8_9ACTN|nr:SMI1/KNR4 family protein [Actinoplanes couchii]MDR6317841.1 hypothetical protein [Actinoplanes couchii]GID59828.1 hypothetical protein Aco03nite_082320 [Actinoplanes couchii]
MDDRITRIQTKLTTLPETLGPPLTEHQVTAFEDRCGIRLPEEFRRFTSRRFCSITLIVDTDFLAWYERWLDFVLTGHRDLTWFTDQMAGDETELVTTLATDPDVARRRAAACTFITYPTGGRSLPGTLAEVYPAEPNAVVRGAILRALGAQGDAGRDLLPVALADRDPELRSLAAILMTHHHRDGRSLSPHLREVLTDHLATEQDPSVRGTITGFLGQSR